MDFFRKMIIGTLHFVAFLVFIGLIVLGGVGGFQTGPEMFAEFGLQETMEGFGLPPFVYAIFGVIAGWIVASVVLGILFILLDIQDGIRDLHRDLTKSGGSSV